MCSVLSAKITFGGKFAREKILIITASDEILNVNFGLIMSDVCLCDNEMQAITGNCTTLSFQLINYERATLRVVMNDMNFSSCNWISLSSSHSLSTSLSLPSSPMPTILIMSNSEEINFPQNQVFNFKAIHITGRWSNKSWETLFMIFVAISTRIQ